MDALIGLFGVRIKRVCKENTGESRINVVARVVIGTPGGRASSGQSGMTTAKENDETIELRNEWHNNGRSGRSVIGAPRQVPQVLQLRGRGTSVEKHDVDRPVVTVDTNVAHSWRGHARLQIGGVCVLAGWKGFNPYRIAEERHAGLPTLGQQDIAGLRSRHRKGVGESGVWRIRVKPPVECVAPSIVAHRIHHGTRYVQGP